MTLRGCLTRVASGLWPLGLPRFGSELDRTKVWSGVRAEPDCQSGSGSGSRWARTWRNSELGPNPEPEGQRTVSTGCTTTTSGSASHDYLSGKRSYQLHFPPAPHIVTQRAT
jgi:hypothetical protein